MTMQKEKTLSMVVAALDQHRGPLSAYDVLKELRQINPKIAPTTVYRALASLIKCGKVHRLESMKAFILCQCEKHRHASIFAICDHCGSVEESVAPNLLMDISSIAGQSGFATTRHVIEIYGLCASCGTRV